MLWYLRARNYDPATGRFTQRDPFAGVGSSPVTLHDYLYGGNDPVMNTDPGGQFFSAGGGMVSASISISLRATNIYGTAHSAAGFLRSLAGGDISDDSGADGSSAHPTFWDLMMSAAITRAFSQISGPSSPIAKSSGSGFGTEKHHVIPVYCCGHVSQRLSRISVSDHQRIHRELQRFVMLVDVAGRGIDLLVYKKPISSATRTPLQRLGKNRVGRAAILSGLEAFYRSTGSMGIGSPSIGQVLLIEGPRFVASHHSASRCRR